MISQSDVVLEVLDSRDPLRYRSDRLESMALKDSGKKLVLVLNKTDLVPKPVVDGWLAYLRRRHPVIPFSKASSTTPLLNLLKNYSRTSTNSKTTTVVGVTGYPNTGKSTIINALTRGTPCSTSSEAGHTKSLKEVKVDSKLTVIDSPGVIGSSGDEEADLLNCVTDGSYSDVLKVAGRVMRRLGVRAACSHYAVPSVEGRGGSGEEEMFCSLVAKSLNLVGKGGVPDKLKGARRVVRDWNEGAFEYYVEAPEDDGHLVGGSAEIVKEGGEEFDLERDFGRKGMEVDGGGLEGAEDFF